VFSAEFIQKTVKKDLIVRLHHVYPQRTLLGKDLEHITGQPTEGDPEGLPCGAGRPVGPSRQSPLLMSVLHCLLDCIYAIILKSVHPTVIEGVDTDR
jgi:hypothetical protein